MPVKIAEAALRIRATGVDEARGKILKLGTTIQSAMRTPAGAERALAPLRQRIDLLAQAAQQQSTRALALTKLGGVEAGLTRTLERGNLTLAQRVRLEEQLRRVQAIRRPPPAPTPVPGVAAGGVGVRGVLAGTLGALGITAGIAGAAAGFRAMGDASDSAEAAQRKLTATSRLTGVSLGAVGAIAATAGDKFSLGERQAADLTAEVVKLTTRAEQSGRSVEFMSSWLDLASANGQTLDDALQGLTTTLAGQDEGLNRLGLRNPTQIWASWGKQIGKTVAQMTDAEKWQAIVNEVVSQGAKVAGTYAVALESTAGQQQQLGKAAEDTAKIYGRALAPIRETLIAGAKGTLEWFGANIDLVASIGTGAAAGGVLWGVVKLTGAVRGLSAAMLAANASAIPGFLGGLVSLGRWAKSPAGLAVIGLTVAVGGITMAMRRAKQPAEEYAAAVGEAVTQLSAADLTSGIAVLEARQKELLRLERDLSAERERTSKLKLADVNNRQAQVMREQQMVDAQLAAMRAEQATRAGAPPPAAGGPAGDGGAPATAEKDATNSLVSALERLHKARNLTAAEWAQVAELERTLTAQRDALATKTGQSAAATIALAEAERRLASVREISDVSAPAITPLVPEILPLPDVNLWKIKPVALTVPVTVTPDVDVRLESARAAVDAQFANLTGNIAGVLGDTLGAAFSGGMSDAGDVLLSGLGSIMQQMGSALVTFGASMIKLLPALSNPLTAGPAALIAGVALIALGGILSGIAGGGGSRGGGGGSGIVAFDDRTERVGLGTGRVTAPVSGVVQPSGSSAGTAMGRVASAPTPINMPILAVNPADPATQRLVNETMRRAERRNL